MYGVLDNVGTFGSKVSNWLLTKRYKAVSKIVLTLILPTHILFDQAIITLKMSMPLAMTVAIAFLQNKSLSYWQLTNATGNMRDYVSEWILGYEYRETYSQAI